MKPAKHLVRVAALASALLLSACADTLWHAAQLPGFKGVSDRTVDRALLRRLSGDPLEELDRNADQGDYSFRGLADWTAKRQWVPGVTAMQYRTSEVEYLTTTEQARWTAAAEQYFARYNKALVPRREGKRLNGYGRLVP